MMESLLKGCDPVWFVDEGESGDYSYAGAARVMEYPGYIAQRNGALEWAFSFDEPCVQMDDDLHPWNHKSPLGMRLTLDGKSHNPITVAAAAKHIHHNMQSVGARLGGIAPTTNIFFYRQPVSQAHFVSACFCVVEPCGQRFDPALVLKADYDYTLQHLREYGVVARCDGVLGNFHRYSNRGGAVAYRTTELMDEMSDLLIERWPDNLRRNSRRPGEILLRWRP